MTAQTAALDATAVFHNTLTPSSDSDATGQRLLSTRGQSHWTVQLVDVGRHWLGRHTWGGFDMSLVHTVPPLTRLVTASCTDTSEACEFETADVACAM